MKFNVAVKSNKKSVFVITVHFSAVTACLLNIGLIQTTFHVCICVFAYLLVKI